MQQSVTIKELYDWARGYSTTGLNRIYLHWTATDYGLSDAYHICIDKNGVVYIMNPLDSTLAATWRRNTGSIAVAIACAYDAVAYSRTDVDLGSAPPTKQQIESMAQVVCALSSALDIDITEDNVMTHAEVADIDNYGIEDSDPDMRWDLLLLPDYDDELRPGGEVIRGKTIWYHYNHDNLF